LPANGFLLLADDAATIAADLPNYSGSIIDTVMSLDNTGAHLKIIDKNGAELAAADYTKNMGGAGNGKTLEWDGTAFRESLIDNGTPGRINSVLSTPASPSPSPTATASSTPTTIPIIENSNGTGTTEQFQYSKDIFINEFLPNPQTGEPEWVELFNSGSQAVDLDGWQLGNASETRTQAIPANSVIGPNDFLVVTFKSSFLNNEGGQIKLLWPDDQVLHAISYQKAPKNIACARLANGQWLWTNQPTPGSDNKKSSYSETADTTQTEASQVLVNAIEEAAPLAETVATNQPAKITAGPLPTASAQPAKNSLPPNLSAVVGQTAAPATKDNLLITLLAIGGLSFLTGIFFVYLRKKQRVDN